ncbi:hypothetical protein HYH02_001486 [Chlamydomonas schloesseri]|uniref:Uncharacterized protein n=1 Tax=Chlamydomonas schloesseri TaxID=2026947 RepID=A0A835WUW9_9CHLO|nr:hypothetical protein HYH02_001486 [Chlamydomonas schloesseri]|eukprot:KAG2454467.1 hypothetical protein HYH02_001486 [Chlamydomonas schloesseri]
MSVRRERGKAAFPPDPNNLGGVQTIIDEYRHMQNRINLARNQPSSTKLAAVKRYAVDMSLAERLSRNRAARNAAVDPIAPEHISRIYHMHRRIEDNYSKTERMKDPWDTTVHPAYLRRPTNVYQEMLKEEMRAWRPTSAPAWAREDRGDSYTGWSVRESLGHAFPKSRYAEALKLADHATYKKAIMAEVLDNRLYKEADLKKLFRAYIRLAPLGDKETVERVVAQLKRELDVQ